MQAVPALIERMLGPGRPTGAAPDFYLFRHAAGVICRCHARLPDALAERLEALANEPRGRPRDWPLEYGRYISLLATIAPVRGVRAGPLYHLAEPPAPRGATVRITAANADLLRGHLPEWREDADAGALMFAAIADDCAVSVCASVRTTPDAHAAGVETAPAYRGRGHASAAVAAWAAAVLQLGSAPLYGTTFDNLASQNVARRLGMILGGSEFWVECDIAGSREPATTR